MSRKTLLLTLAALCFAGGFAAVVFAPIGSSESGTRPADIHALHLVGYDESGDVRWLLDATSGSMMQETQTGSLSGLTLQFAKQGDVTLSVTAGHVDFTPQQGKLTQSPSLIAHRTETRSREYTLSADEMMWWRQDETLLGSEASALFSAGWLTAPMMELSLPNEHLSFHGGVVLSIELEDGRIADISAEIASMVNDQVVIERSVIVEIGDDIYHCETMTLETTEDSTLVSSILLEGDVSASFSQGEITADTLRVTSNGWEADGQVFLEFEVELDETLLNPENDA
ncbi:hypothetical protein JW848_05090 [Candidatus Bipolaricaulota bacterium]|nr:hypothetical protein [Candidatus Bipolaricaulota bacterium]